LQIRLTPKKTESATPHLMNDYYVYVYIDPRNFEEFYYGKGRGSRKEAHLFDIGDSPKTKRISEIKLSGLAPIIRVISRNLTEDQALLVEATLLWKLGKYTTNLVAGHFTDNLRPHDTMHRELSGFDFQNGLYYFNVGEGPHRLWDDCRKMGFISAGGNKRWREAICGFQVGDVFAAYLKGKGFVGIGKIKGKARMIRDVLLNGKTLISLAPNMAHDCDSPNLSEYSALVEWIRAVPAGEAKTRKAPKLFTTPLVRASLDNQPKTIEFLESEFDVDFKDYLS
jgi:uncharacterized protein